MIARAMVMVVMMIMVVAMIMRMVMRAPHRRQSYTQASSASRRTTPMRASMVLP